MLNNLLNLNHGYIPERRPSWYNTNTHKHTNTHIKIYMNMYVLFYVRIYFTKFGQPIVYLEFAVYNHK